LAAWTSNIIKNVIYKARPRRAPSSSI
jgi:hypothetical protein